MAKNKEFFIHTSQTEKILYLSKVQNLRGAELDKCRMTPDDVDFEMSTGKDPEILEICGYEYQTGEIETRTLFEFQEQGEDEQGKILGCLVRKNELTNRQKLDRAGIRL